MREQAIRARATERRTQALEYRAQRMSYRVIAETMGISVGRAHQLVQEGLQERLGAQHEAAEHLVQIELESLDQLARHLQAQLDGPDTDPVGYWIDKGPVIDRLLKVSISRRKLLGIDQQTQQVSGNVVHYVVEGIDPASVVGP